MSTVPKRVRKSMQCAICGAPSAMVEGADGRLHPTGRCSLHRFVDAHEGDEVIASCGDDVTIPPRVTFTDVEPPHDEDTQPGPLPLGGHEPLWNTCRRGRREDEE